MGLNLIFLGPPGVGKGTQAEAVSAHFLVPKLSTGDLLREGVAKGTPLGKEAKAYMDRGELVPDPIIMGLVRDRLAGTNCREGFLFDGFPRTVPQADQLAALLESMEQSLNRVVCFVLSREEIVRRLSGRRNCPRCQAVFHVESRPPKQEGQCDKCGTALVQRNDDQPETVEARLIVYENQTAPLIQYYKNQNVLSELDASGPIQAVQERLMALLSSL